MPTVDPVPYPVSCIDLDDPLVFTASMNVFEAGVAVDSPKEKVVSFQKKLGLSCVRFPVDPAKITEPCVNPPMSVPETARNVGTAGEPDTGPANTVPADCTLKLPVRVPAVVTGLPVTVNTEVGRLSPTLVTDPPASVLDIVMVLPTSVSMMPDPAARVTAPVIPFTLVTPEGGGSSIHVSVGHILKSLRV